MKQLKVTKIVVEELPTTCFECPFSMQTVDENGTCAITGAVFYPYRHITYRVAGCPLMTQEQMADWLFFTQNSTKMIRLAFDGGSNSPVIKEYIEKIKRGDKLGVVTW